MGFFVVGGLEQNRNMAIFGGSRRKLVVESPRKATSAAVFGWPRAGAVTRFAGLTMKRLAADESEASQRRQVWQAASTK